MMLREYVNDNDDPYSNKFIEIECINTIDGIRIRTCLVNLNLCYPLDTISYSRELLRKVQQRTTEFCQNCHGSEIAYTLFHSGTEDKISTWCENCYPFKNDKE